MFHARLCMCFKVRSFTFLFFVTVFLNWKLNRVLQIIKSLLILFDDKVLLKYFMCLYYFRITLTIFQIKTSVCAVFEEVCKRWRLEIRKLGKIVLECLWTKVCFSHFPLSYNQIFHLQNHLFIVLPWPQPPHMSRN